MDTAVAHCPVTHCPAAQWYVIQTKPRQEARAQAHLVRQGFECYLPVAEYAAGASVAQLVPTPLFPGYLFIRIAREASWYPIRSTRGVARVVAFGPQPCAVNDGLIAGLRQRSGSGLEAIFLCNDGDKRAVILLALLAHQQRVALPRQPLKQVVTHAY
ncbi:MULTISPECIES: transcription termination/antitermination NusG family protein [Pseudomonas]|uniref:Transcription/translation regulatory transformer protein RfaH n=1 Tax=Pseudomonas quercus TaxID=2722792 RepID=A0ABX0YIP2_9PSED|nr:MULTISPECIES: transcription termination/antitermination NusG family protein [Pseudomonas]MBF7144290.1 transcription/translation regulatory transformer protein RfaH [Pseudomonas sp. LY10J]NJP02830.1 transcription/translation regulatory transformer protein RfaH [Pseudomonas quercus]